MNKLPENDFDRTTSRLCPLCGGGEYREIMRVDLDSAQAEHLGVAGFPLVKCLSCGLLYLTPRPSDELLNFYYSESERSREFMNDFMISDRNAQSAYWNDAVSGLQKFNGGAPGRLLDIGCGAGWFVKIAADRGWDSHGVDMSGILADAAEKTAPGRIRHAPFKASDYERASFDAVTMFDVLEHVVDPVRIVEDAAALLKPGGVLLVTVPDADSIFFRLYGRRWRMIITVGHLVYFTRSTLEALLARHGLRPALRIRPEFDRHGAASPLAVRAIETAKFLARLVPAVTYHPFHRLFLSRVPGLKNWKLRIGGMEISHNDIQKKFPRYPSIADSTRIYAVKDRRTP